MAKIWRVETKDGDGFFQSRWHRNFYEIADKHDLELPDWGGSEDFPSSLQDLKHQFIGRWHHGCNSWAEIRRWFPETLDKALEEAGYYFSLFEVPEEVCRHGKTQSIFDINKAVLIKKLKPTEFEKEKEFA